MKVSFYFSRSFRSLGSVVGVLGVLLCSSICAAQDAVWTEPRVLAHAEEHGPRVIDARAMVLATQAGEAHARVPVVGNPVVGVRAMFGVPDDSAATYALQFGFPFDVSGVRRAWSTEQREAIEVARAAVSVARREARAEALQAYAALLIANNAMHNAREQVTAQQQLLDRERTRIAVNASTAVELAQAEQELAVAQASLIAVQAERAEAETQFRQALDLPATASVQTGPFHVPSLSDDFTLATAVRSAEEQRLSARVFEASARQLRASQDRYRAAAISPLTINAEVEIQGNSQRASTVGLSANWMLPLLQTAQGERAVAEGEAQRAQIQASLATRTAMRDAAGAWQTLQARLQELSLLDQNALPAAERARQLTDTLFESNAVDFFRVLFVRRSLYDLRTRRLNAAREAWRARVALERAVLGLR